MKTKANINTFPTCHEQETIHIYECVFRWGAVSGLPIKANAIENVLSGMQFVTKLNRNGYYNGNKLVNFIQC